MATGERGHFYVEVFGEAGLARHDGSEERWLKRCPIGWVARGRVLVGGCGLRGGELMVCCGGRVEESEG